MILISRSSFDSAQDDLEIPIQDDLEIAIRMILKSKWLQKEFQKGSVIGHYWGWDGLFGKVVREERQGHEAGAGHQANGLMSQPVRSPYMSRDKLQGRIRRKRPKRKQE